MKLRTLLAPLGLALILAALAPLSHAAPGLAVGTAAPAFALPSAHGEQLTLNDLLRKGPVALVFYRSADWCP